LKFRVWLTCSGRMTYGDGKHRQSPLLFVAVLTGRRWGAAVRVEMAMARSVHVPGMLASRTCSMSHKRTEKVSRQEHARMKMQRQHTQARSPYSIHREEFSSQPSVARRPLKRVLTQVLVVNSKPDCGRKPYPAWPSGIPFSKGHP
jgi:hypothetical protein